MIVDQEKRVYSGHWIFVRDNESLSDTEFLGFFDCSTQNPLESPEYTNFYAGVGRAPGWVSFLDDGFYSLYNSHDRLALGIERLANQFEVLRIAVGDADNSYEFYHYRDGRRVRAFSFDDWGPNSKGVVLDEGTKFDSETSFESDGDPTENVLKIPEEIGISIATLHSGIRFYLQGDYRVSRSSETNEPNKAE
ncbi:hypothetical protein VSU19_03600 [Verrucomicrobiales bacterium BCK34]|nr:hypothetical protein [Verrucomicrobiales bacterium BCK34]